MLRDKFIDALRQLGLMVQMDHTTAAPRLRIQDQLGHITWLTNDELKKLLE